MPLIHFIFSVFFVATITVLYHLFFHDQVKTFIAFVISSIATALAIVAIEKLKKVDVRQLIGGLVGAFLSLIIGRLITKNDFTFIIDQKIYNYVIAFTQILIFYIGIHLGVKKGGEFNLKTFLKKADEEKNYKILDTSVIIDGRIAEICETGFIEGTLLIPQFVLIELQHIADSHDHLKRVRGRRGLDIIKRIQSQTNIEVEITDIDFPKVKEVDSKLILLAQRLNGKIITNDFNLLKLAEVQGIDVLNINALATALRPVALPGETLTITIIKEGKEERQGIGYLDDGTMVVVEDGIDKIGQKLDVVVTSILQTTAGRMIFGKIKNNHNHNK